MTPMSSCQGKQHDTSDSVRYLYYCIVKVIVQDNVSFTYTLPRFLLQTTITQYSS